MQALRVGALSTASRQRGPRSQAARVFSHGARAVAGGTIAAIAVANLSNAGSIAASISISISILIASLSASGCSPAHTQPNANGADDLAAVAPADLGNGPGDGDDLALADGGNVPDGGDGGVLSPWILTWSDEFNGPAGAVDATKWSFDVGTGPNNDGWGNGELEYYSDRLDNVTVDGNGALDLIARKESFMSASYTSGRINTAGKFSQAYGRFEARIQIAQGQGLWPAFWTLGDNIGSVGWPMCGELDIQETVNASPTVNHGSAHGPGYSGGNPLTGIYTLPKGALSDGYHLYAIEWEPNEVRWYVDDNLYETRTPADVPKGDVWVYDHPFYVILNLAVGGQFPGPPDGTTVFPQTTRIDYVRVYEKR